MVLLYTIKGQRVYNGLISVDGKRVRPGTTLLIDGTRLYVPQDHTIPVYEFTSTLQSKILTGTLINYNITLECTNDVDPGKPLTISVPMPAGFTYISHATNEGTYNESTEKWVVTLEDQQAILNLTLQPDTPGATSQTVSLDGGTATLTSNTTIYDADSDGTICSHEISLNDYPLTLANMQDGQTYTITAYSKVSDTGIVGVYDGIKNNRLSVNNGTEIFANRAETEDVITKINVTFTYDNETEVVIKFYSQYQGASTTQTDRWYGLCLQEGLNTVYGESVNLLSNPLAMLDDTTSTPLVIDGDSESAEYTFNVSVAALSNPLSFFNGIRLSFNSFGLIGSGIEAQITSSTGTVSTLQSEYISRTGGIVFGGIGELWDLQSSDIENETISITLKFTNTTLTNQTYSYNNLLLTLYYIEDQTGQSLGFTAKNVHSMNYQLYLLGAEIPEGPERSIDTINFPSSDGEVITSHSLEAKEIEIKFVVWGDTLSEAKQKLRQINQWLTNERNSLSIPIPYTLIFDFEEDVSYEVVFGEPIDTDIEFTSIVCTATFTVESGVALTSETKTTGPVGVNGGVTKVRPIVNVIADGSSTITITDGVSGQMVKINETIASNTLLTVDCEDRTVIDSEGNDYTNDVDIESVWFNFFNNYNLSCSGGIVQSVAYKEGY